jgi:coenzyme A diphosphatase NUDT7
MEIMELKGILAKLQNRTPSILGSEDFSKYAILLPLIRKEDGIHIVFEVRSLKLRRQPGEICFPGGRIDPGDDNEKSAAIRETLEELGLNKMDISEVHPLDFLISPFGMILYPFVGFIEGAKKIRPNPSEVEETFTVPLSFFLENNPKIFQVKLQPVPEEDFPYDLIIGGENYRWQPRQMDEYFYLYENRVIWGLTAKILSHFIDILQDNDKRIVQLSRNEGI